MSTQPDVGGTAPSCAVCLSALKKDLVALQCGHVFHESWCVHARGCCSVAVVVTALMSAVHPQLRAVHAGVQDAVPDVPMRDIRATALPQTLLRH
jgi:hypothetical protein